MANWEINRELVLSTAHLPDSDRLLLGLDDPGTLVMPYTHGWRIYAETSGLTRPYSGTLVRLLQLAVDLDCKWLVLDCDGPVMEELETFEWR